MAQLVYLFWHHGEHGPEETTATLDRAELPGLMMAYDQNNWFAKTGDDVVGKLNELLLKTDEELLAKNAGMYPLMNGWGGLHFQVVKLQ